MGIKEQVERDLDEAHAMMAELGHGPLGWHPCTDSKELFHMHCLLCGEWATARAVLDMPGVRVVSIDVPRGACCGKGGGGHEQ